MWLLVVSCPPKLRCPFLDCGLQWKNVPVPIHGYAPASVAEMNNHNHHPTYQRCFASFLTAVVQQALTVIQNFLVTGCSLISAV